MDSAYVDAALLVSSQRDHGITLQGPVRGISTWQSRMGQGYDLPHFAIDWDPNRSPARKARLQSLGARRAATMEVRASTLGLAAQIVALAPLGRSARQQKMHIVPSIFIHVRNMRR